MTIKIDWKKEQHAPKSGQRVCQFDDLEIGVVKEFKFGSNEPFRMIVYRVDDDVFGYMNQCPHHWIAMNHNEGPFKMWDKANHQMMCTHHAAIFELARGGNCIDGPCKGSSLTRVPLTVTNGQVFIANE